MFGGKFGGATTGSVHVRSYKNNVHLYVNINGKPLHGYKRKAETIEAAIQRTIESESGAKFERLELGSEIVRRRDAPAAPAAVSMPRRRPTRDLFDPSKLMLPGELARMQGRATGSRIGLHPHVSNGRPMFGRPPATTLRVRHRTPMYDPSKHMRPGELARMQGSQTTGRRRGPPHVPNGRPMFGRPPRRRPETPPAAADECAICLEDLDDASPALACGHKFHEACMRELADAASSLFV